MAYTEVNYESVEPKASGMHFLRDALDLEKLGFTVIEVEAGWTGMEHDHADEGHEEVYHLVQGSATITVDGEDVELGDGDTVRVDPETTRQLHAEEDCYFVVAGSS